MSIPDDPQRVPPGEPGWELYRTLLAAIEEGSLSGAARALGIAQPTAGRHIEALERALRCTLFIRSPQGLVPTEAALALRPHAEALHATAAALLRTASSLGEGARGVVRISASQVVGVEVLPPILARLREQHPDLAVEVSVSNALSDLLHSEADIAVRMVRPTHEALVARKVGTIEVGMFARRSYLARHGTPSAAGDLARHALIGFDRETPFLRGLRAQAGPMQRAAFSLRSDSDLVQLAAVRAGYGIGFCQVPLARGDRHLVRVLAKAFSLPLETWIVMHRNLKESLRCKVAFAALAQGMADYIAGT